MRGSAPGERRGGRQKGTPNRVTDKARELVRRVYEDRLEDLERWILETGDGFDIVKLTKDGTQVTLKVGKDPGKAAELMLRLAEFFLPKLGRVEVSPPAKSDAPPADLTPGETAEAERLATEELN